EYHDLVRHPIVGVILKSVPIAAGLSALFYLRVFPLLGGISVELPGVGQVRAIGIEHLLNEFLAPGKRVIFLLFRLDEHIGRTGLPDRFHLCAFGIAAVPITAEGLLAQAIVGFQRPGAAAVVKAVARLVGDAVLHLGDVQAVHIRAAIGILDGN